MFFTLCYMSIELYHSTLWILKAWYITLLRSAAALFSFGLALAHHRLHTDSRTAAVVPPQLTIDAPETCSVDHSPTVREVTNPHRHALNCKLDRSPSINSDPLRKHEKPIQDNRQSCESSLSNYNNWRQQGRILIRLLLFTRL